MRCLIARCNEESIRVALPATEARIGSAPFNEIALPFPGISRSHALLIPRPNGAILRDLGSKNRLYLNGERVDEALLQPGVVVQIGRAMLSIEDASTSEIELGIVIGASGRDSASRWTETRSDSDGAGDDTSARALRLVREMELAGPRRIRGGLQTFMAKSRNALRAEAIVLLRVEKEGEAIVAADGPIPSEAAVNQIVAAIQRDRKAAPSTLRQINGWTALITRTFDRARIRCLVALFEDDHRAIADWQKDLFEFIASKILEIDSDYVPGDGETDEAQLRIPADMIVGESASMQRLLAQIRATVRSAMDVLLSGETGTGKELFARMIHASGASASGPFVAINCAAIPSELLESELFGVHGRVATGVDPRPGLFQQADGGSIFLDEIGELAEPLQAKILRVLQEREVLPLGAPAPRKIDVRVIAATNRELLARVGEGRFRADLYYRLRGLHFHIPPLRDRREDIPALVLAFVQRAAEAHKKRIGGISRRALQILTEHAWPGNIRELQSEVERAVLLCPTGGSLQSDHFAPVKWAVGEGSRPAAPVPAAREPSQETTPNDRSLTLQEQLAAVERGVIQKALQEARGNKSLAARMLGITRNGLAIKMKRLALKSRTR